MQIFERMSVRKCAFLLQFQIYDQSKCKVLISEIHCSFETKC